MMKKSTLLTMVIFMIAILIYSCDKDEFSEDDAYQYERDLKAMEAELAQDLEEARLEWLQDSLQAVRERDSLERIGGIINYAINVVNAGNAGFQKSATKENEWLHGTVTISQNHVKMSQNIGTDGIAVFEDLRIGQVAVHIDCPGYTTVDYIAQLNPEWTMEDYYGAETGYEVDKAPEGSTVVAPIDNDQLDVDVEIITGVTNEVIPLDEQYYGVKRNASTLVPVFPTEGNSLSTIKGQVTWETNLTNNEPEIAEGVEVIGMIDTEDEDFKAKYLAAGSLNDTGLNHCGQCLYGHITQIVYGDVVMKSVSGMDTEYFEANMNVTNKTGEYMVRVPSTATGLPIKMTISEIATDQYLLMNTLYGEQVFGIQNQRVIFSSEVGNGYTDLTVEDISPIPVVPPAYCIFEAPTQQSHVKPAIEASATAIIAESGIEYIQIQDHGNCYTQAPQVIIKQYVCEDCDVINTSAKAEAVMVDGMVSEIKITDPGTGYRNVLANGTPKGFDQGGIAVELVSVVDSAEIVPIVTYSVVDVNVPDTPEQLDYLGNPVVTFNADAGDDAVLQAVTSQYVSEIEILNDGEGYTSIPDVYLNNVGGEPTIAAKLGTPVMSEKNPIHSIELLSSTLKSNVYDEPPFVQVDGAGTGAKVYAQLSDIGGCGSIIVTNGGSGYSDVPGYEPTVEIIGDGWGAVAHANVSGGKIMSIDVDEPGTGYTSAPTVVISAPVEDGGIQAVATAKFGRPIEKLLVSDNGGGYMASTTAGEQTTVTIDGDDVVVQDEKNTADGDVLVKYEMSIKSIPLSANQDITGGTGYMAAPEVIIGGDGKNAVAKAIMKTDIIDVQVAAGGEGYLAHCKDPNQMVLIDGDSISGFSAELGKGTLSDVYIAEGGSGYTAPPRIKLTYGGTNIANSNAEILNHLELIGMVRNGEIVDVSIEMDEPFSLDDLDLVEEKCTTEFKISVETYCDLASASANTYANAGQIKEIIVNNPGAGYTIVPTVEIQAVGLGDKGSLGQGFGAEATAVLKDGRVAEIIVDNPGYGYLDTAIIVINVPDYTETAVGVPMVSASGRITGVSFSATADSDGAAEYTHLTAGNGYDSENPPAVTFYPSIPNQGKGAKGICVVKSGVIDTVLMQDGGSGYLGKNLGAPLCTSVDMATDLLNTDETNAGIPLQVSPFFGGWYGHASDGAPNDTRAQGIKLQAEAGKTYIKDIYLGTGLRTEQINAENIEN